MLLSFSIKHNLYSQPTIEWSFLDGYTHEDVGYAIDVSSDNGYTIAGTRGFFDGTKGFWALNLNEDGSISWDKRFSPIFSFDEAFAIDRTSDGGYIVAGVADTYNEPFPNFVLRDAKIIKLNYQGAVHWTMQYGSEDEIEVARSIEETSDGGFIVGGYSFSEESSMYKTWLLKLNSDGNVLWEKNYGGSSWEECRSIAVTSDGGYILAGFSRPDDGYGRQDYWVLKLDSEGNIEWEQNYGGSRDDFAHKIKQTSDGGYIVAGYSRSSDFDVSKNNGEEDIWILKLDSSGDIEWEKSYGGTSEDKAYSVIESKFGGFIVGGASNSNDIDVSNNYGKRDSWILKLSTVGNLEWEMNLGGSEDDVTYDLKETHDGKIIITGYAISNDGDLINNQNNGWRDLWVCKLDQGISSTLKPSETSETLKIFPNPVSNLLQIKTNGSEIKKGHIRIISTDGKILYNSMTKFSSINIEDFSPGLYIVEYKSEGNSFVQKFVKK